MDESIRRMIDGEPDAGDIELMPLRAASLAGGGPAGEPPEVRQCGPLTPPRRLSQLPATVTRLLVLAPLSRDKSPRTRGTSWRTLHPHGVEILGTMALTSGKEANAQHRRAKLPWRGSNANRPTAQVQERQSGGRSGSDARRVSQRVDRSCDALMAAAVNHTVADICKHMLVGEGFPKEWTEWIRARSPPPQLRQRHYTSCCFRSSGH